MDAEKYIRVCGHRKWCALRRGGDDCNCGHDAALAELERLRAEVEELRRELEEAAE